MSEIDDAVRAWAKGVYSVEAGAELLIRGGKAIYEGAPWLNESTSAEGARMVSVDTDFLYLESGAWSGSESRMTAVAVSLLAGGHLVDLNDAVSGLDPERLQLVLAAIAHAAGSHEARMPIIVDNTIRGYTEPESAFPWPAPPAAVSNRSRLRSVMHDGETLGGGPAPRTP